MHQLSEISISPDRLLAVPGPPHTLRISSEGLDLSNVKTEQIKIRPATDIFGVTVISATEHALTLSFSLRLVDDDTFPGIVRELTITVNDVSASATFKVLPT